MFASLSVRPTLACAWSVLLLCAWPAGSAMAQSAATSPAKKELIDRVLELQRPALEAMGSMLAAQPVQALQTQVGPILQQRVPAERREVVVREIEADVRKYLEEAVPLIRAQAVKAAPSTLGVVLDERMDEAELRQLVTALEAPALRKFQQLSGEGQRALSQKLVAEARPVIEPRTRALEAAVAKRLGMTPQGTAPGPASSPKK